MSLWRSNVVDIEVEPAEEIQVDFLSPDTVKQIKRTHFQKWKRLKKTMKVSLIADLIYSIFLIGLVSYIIIAFHTERENYWVGSGVSFALFCVMRFTQCALQYGANKKVSNNDPVIIKGEGSNLQKQALFIQEISGTLEVSIILFLQYWIMWDDVSLTLSSIGFIIIWNVCAIFGKNHIVHTVFPNYLYRLEFYQEVYRKYP